MKTDVIIDMFEYNFKKLIFTFDTRGGSHSLIKLIFEFYSTIYYILIVTSKPFKSHVMDVRWTFCVDVDTG